MALTEASRSWEMSMETCPTPLSSIVTPLISSFLYSGPILLEDRVTFSPFRIISASSAAV